MKLLVLLKKDFLLDWRGLAQFISVLFFSVLLLLIFSFTLPQNSLFRDKNSTGLFVVSFLFSGLLSLHRSFTPEIQDYCFDAIISAPIDKGSLFLSKLIQNFIFIFIIQILLIPLFALFLDIRFLTYFGYIVIVIGFACLGFCSLGTLISAIVVKLNGKELLLPLLLFPLLVPLVLAVVLILGHLFTGQAIFNTDEFHLLVSFSLVYTLLSYLVFDFVIEG